MKRSGYERMLLRRGYRRFRGTHLLESRDGRIRLHVLRSGRVRLWGRPTALSARRLCPHQLATALELDVQGRTGLVRVDGGRVLLPPALGRGPIPRVGGGSRLAPHLQPLSRAPVVVDPGYYQPATFLRDPFARRLRRRAYKHNARRFKKLR